MSIDTLCSLQFETTLNYQNNLDTFINHIQSAPKNSLIVAPEVCLTGFDYHHFDEAASFGIDALDAIVAVSDQKTIIFTLIEKRENKVYNMLKVLDNKKLVYERGKIELFRLGDEEKHFHVDETWHVEQFEINGVKIGVLICFELRFKEYWKALEGCDIIAVPAWWGRLRGEHFRALTQALAIMNQCYVVASDSANDVCSGLGGVILPDGEEFRNGTKVSNIHSYEPKEIKKMRRYIDVGIR